MSFMKAKACITYEDFIDEPGNIARKLFEEITVCPEILEQIRFMSDLAKLLVNQKARFEKIKDTSIRVEPSLAALDNKESEDDIYQDTRAKFNAMVRTLNHEHNLNILRVSNEDIMPGFGGESPVPPLSPAPILSRRLSMAKLLTPRLTPSPSSSTSGSSPSPV